VQDSAASKPPELSLLLDLVFSTVWVLVGEGETISACPIWACPTLGAESMPLLPTSILAVVSFYTSLESIYTLCDAKYLVSQVGINLTADLSII